jgi:hypothetical protein
MGDFIKIHSIPSVVKWPIIYLEQDKNITSVRGKESISPDVNRTALEKGKKKKKKTLADANQVYSEKS